MERTNDGVRQVCFYCRFVREGVRGGWRCHRRAPLSYDFMRYCYQLELLRDIAVSVRDLAWRPKAEPGSDVATEAAESIDDATWPRVHAGDWCGEWEAKLEE
jgi:hypothetical protein